MIDKEKWTYSKTWKGKEYRQSSWKEKIGLLSLSQKRATVECEDGEIYYIFGLRTAGYVHGDKVVIEPTREAKEGKLPEARPTRLLTRSKEPLLAECILLRGKKNLRILPELWGLPIEISSLSESAETGDLYIVTYTGKKEGKIMRFFWKKSDPAVKEEILLFRYGIRTEWPIEIEKEIIKSLEILPENKKSPLDNALSGKSTIPNSIKISDKTLFPRIKIYGKERFDFRSWPTMTIDGADAKDLDDAISLAQYENGDFLLGVHIADVAEYVSRWTHLDREANLRGTSVYMPGRVIPMLPEILSNDRCSLHPWAPKAVLSILMRIEKSGQVKESFITEWIIESIHRGIYDDVNQLIIENWQWIKKEEELWTQWGLGEETVWVRWEQENARQKRASFSSTKGFGTFPSKSTEIGPWKVQSDTLKDFYSLYKILEARRKKEGKILFEMTECYFTLDEKRNVIGITKRERNDAHMMIEEFMVLANEEVAKWCVKNKLPFLSRVHGVPDTEDMKSLSEILENLSLATRLEPHHIRDHLEQITDPKERYRLSRLLLPKMAKAFYGDTPKWHFGLALQYYSHFTSPIRRYPDLLVHRIIKEFLHGDFSKEDKDFYTRSMKRMGKSLSEKEKQAESVERAIDSLMMCRYMSDKVGQSFDGIISWLTESNIYVELDSGIEWSIFLKSPTYKNKGTFMAVDPIRGSLKNRKWEELYRIGNDIHIKILSVDLEERRIEMSEI